MLGYLLSSIYDINKDSGIILITEHDACAKNLGELDWHINSSSLKKQESVSLLRGVEAYNIKLKQEITTVDNNTLVFLFHMQLFYYNI